MKLFNAITGLCSITACCFLYQMPVMAELSAKQKAELDYAHSVGFYRGTLELACAFYALGKIDKRTFKIVINNAHDEAVESRYASTPYMEYLMLVDTNQDLDQFKLCKNAAR